LPALSSCPYKRLAAIAVDLHQTLRHCSCRCSQDSSTSKLSLSVSRTCIHYLSVIVGSLHLRFAVSTIHPTGLSEVIRGTLKAVDALRRRKRLAGFWDRPNQSKKGVKRSLKEVGFHSGHPGEAYVSFLHPQLLPTDPRALLTIRPWPYPIHRHYLTCTHRR